MRMRSGSVVVLVLAMVSGGAAAKPTDVPAPPKSDGQVPPTSVQDFFTKPPCNPEPESPARVPVRRNLPVVGKWFDVLGNAICPWRTARAAFGIEAEEPRRLADTPLQNLERIKEAARYVELGESLSEAGDARLAAAAYSKAMSLAPGSRYGQIAASRIDRLPAQAAEAESEEPAPGIKSFRWGPFVLEFGKRSFSVGLVIDFDQPK